MEVLPGPDFPTGGLVMGKSGIHRAYETGKGSIVFLVRVPKLKTTKSGRERIVVTEFPYMVNKTKVHEHIVRLAQEKRIEGITAVRDESSREGVRFVIEVRRDASANVILNNLFKLTQLQTNFSFNMLAIEKGVPKSFPCVKFWLTILLTKKRLWSVVHSLIRIRLKHVPIF